MSDSKSTRLGLVAIGRNEGERLKRCFQSIPAGVPVAYVDSASTDDSIAFARDRGAIVVSLDMTLPFSAARARNAGFERLHAAYPDLEFVQFVDGDCEFEAGWLDAARLFMIREPQFAATCGRRRERFPQASFYNEMMDAEWNTSPGETSACGGDVMMRVSAFIDVDGYNPAIIAGEEPELCGRLRHEGWRIWRLDEPMTVHDANMHHFRQWWMRAVRSGFGYAQVWCKTARSEEPLYRKQVISALFWSVGITAAALLLGYAFSPVALLLAPLLWGAQLLRLTRRLGPATAWILMIGKFAETLGIARFFLSSIMRRKQGAIFYK